jgi:hypothetical protein
MSEENRIFIPTEFEGEVIECSLCPRKQKSVQKRNANWRAFTLDGTTYYVCPIHFPPDGSKARKFTAAYKRILDRLMRKYHIELVDDPSGEQGNR